MEQLTPAERDQLAELLYRLIALPDELADVNDIADMMIVYMTNRNWAYNHQDFDRIFQCVDEACLRKQTRFDCSEAVENWIHYYSPDDREEICAPPDNSVFPNELDYLQGKA